MVYPSGAIVIVIRNFAVYNRLVTNRHYSNDTLPAN